MADQQKNRCLYDVLCVSRDCSPEEIRSAYRRLALQLHPDKLAQSGVSSAVEGSTAAFQELLHAYEVLSDPKERAWYDSHRSQIIFSDPSAASKSSFFFSGLDLFSFFSTSVYSGYADSGKGFFKVYGDLFAKIYAQELNFASRLGMPSDTVDPAPLFGNLESLYSQVTAFYNYWLGYLTVLDFAWMDEYDSFAGPNRKERRLMAEENKKARKKAKREHIDMVRSLAAFVKKRDKRAIDMQKKKIEEDEKKKAEEKERKKEEERKKKERAMIYEEPDWVKNCEEDNLIWDDDEEDDKKMKGNFGVEMYCVACNKKFKSDKQWKNHEQSKKHREKVAELKSAFDDEEEALKDFGQDGLCVSFEYEPQAEENVVRENEADQLSEVLKDDLTLHDEEDDNGSTINNGSARNINEIEKNTEYHALKGIRNGINHREKRGDGAETMDNDERNDSQRDGCEVYESKGDPSEELSSSVEENLENSKGDKIFGKTTKLKKQELDGKEDRKKDAIPPKRSLKGKKQKHFPCTVNVGRVRQFSKLRTRSRQRGVFLSEPDQDSTVGCGVLSF